MPIPSPVTDDLFLLNQRKKIFFPRKNVQDATVELETEADTLPTELPLPVVNRCVSVKGLLTVRLIFSGTLHFYFIIVLQ